MPEDEHRERRFYAVSYEEDIPRPGRGLLIPYQKKAVLKRASIVRAIVPYVRPTIIVITASLFLFALSTVGIGTYSRYQTASLPAVTVVNPLTQEARPLQYGVQLLLEQPNFFADTRDAFIESAVTFIEVDLPKKQLRYFEDGVLVKSFTIIGKGEHGSWWEVPSGLYELEAKNERHFSSFGRIYQPWSLVFANNFYIHGVPEQVDGTPVEAETGLGYIQLANEDAETLYDLVKLHTPILVHDLQGDSSAFLYEPKVPELETPHYLIADVESSTVLASSDLETPAPIASVTKLMTALVAVEQLNLDTSVFVTQPTFVESLVPRLGDRTKVSMYSLLQLLLVESSNEAAEVIAAQLGRERFIELMNERAVSLGLSKTVFADPSGLSAENISSLGDLLRLTQYIYEHRRFIFSVTKDENTPTPYVGGEFGDLINFNEVEALDNFIGGKVGETLAAGQTSVTLHTLEVKGQTRTLAIIILGSNDRNRDVKQLYEYAKDRFAR